MKQFFVYLTLSCASALAIAHGTDTPRSAPSDARQFEQVSRLAASGDSGAMLRLGEMYWYGDGLTIDRDKADELFRKAAKAGNPNAQAALRLTPDRQARLSDIAYWTETITARQLTGTEFNCKGPAFPLFSDIRVDAVKVVKSYEAYRTCYNGYVEKLFGDLPTVRRIPADVSLLMSEDEFDRARAHIDALVAATVADLQRLSAPVLTERDRWVAHSLSYITTQELRRNSAREVESANARACAGIQGC